MDHNTKKEFKSAHDYSGGAIPKNTYDETLEKALIDHLDAGGTEQSFYQAYLKKMAEQKISGSSADLG